MPSPGLLGRCFILNKPLLAVELLSVLSLTVFYGGSIIRTAEPYQGKLSWYLEEKLYTRKIPLAEDNLYEGAVSELFTSLDQIRPLPEELYLSGQFKMNITSDGTITELEAFLYGKDKKGSFQSYLLDYDKKKGGEMTVYLNNSCNAEYSEEKKLAPLLQILEDNDIQAFLRKNGPDEPAWKLRYLGYQHIDAKGKTGYTLSLQPQAENSSSEIFYLIDENEPVEETTRLRAEG
ncbi:MAG: hypothetical protein SPF91_05180 [Clostridium sp.]|nr:hypothetical protein [Clostridiaceae bacterium]MDD6073817.1 hypothetical protein [Clostridium sp.]MDY5483573.1 hypothetical protein [Clostridium sp.]